MNSLEIKLLNVSMHTHTYIHTHRGSLSSEGLKSKIAVTQAISLLGFSSFTLRSSRPRTETLQCVEDSEMKDGICCPGTGIGFWDLGEPEVLWEGRKITGFGYTSCEDSCVGEDGDGHQLLVGK